LKEINNTRFKNIYLENRLKKYIKRNQNFQIFAKSKNKNKKIKNNFI